jgi:3-dehydroquinate synthase
MASLIISTKEKSYPIYIGNGLRYQIQTILEKNAIPYDSVLIITDDNVAPLYLSDVAKGLKAPVHTFIVNNGEEAKSFANYITIQTYAIQKKLTRQSLIIALGGGVIGDLAGFIAATFLRGISYIQMPTTILAHDSAVGGKVAINHDLGKNLIGAFYHPQAVVYDLETLNSLPRRQQMSGFAEVIKHGLIDKDQALLPFISGKDQDELFSDYHFLREILSHGMKIKAEIVKKDEKETNIRKFLNFGHTLGHAIESESNYRYLHGEAVIIGMIFALYVSEVYFSKELGFQKYKTWFEKLGYETSIPPSLPITNLIEKMKVDKKVVANHIHMILLRDIGEPVVVRFTTEEITEFMHLFIRE